MDQVGKDEVPHHHNRQREVRFQMVSLHQIECILIQLKLFLGINHLHAFIHQIIIDFTKLFFQLSIQEYGNLDLIQHKLIQYYQRINLSYDSSPYQLELMKVFFRLPKLLHQQLLLRLPSHLLIQHLKHIQSGVIDL